MYGLGIIALELLFGQIQIKKLGDSRYFLLLKNYEIFL